MLVRLKRKRVAGSLNGWRGSRVAGKQAERDCLAHRSEGYVPYAGRTPRRFPSLATGQPRGALADGCLATSDERVVGYHRTGHTFCCMKMADVRNRRLARGSAVAS